jgi:hypothetical protein
MEDLEETGKVRIVRLAEAFQKFQDKTFDEFSFEEFVGQFHSDLVSTQREFLFDLYSQLVSMTRSSTEVCNLGHAPMIPSI